MLGVQLSSPTTFLGTFTPGVARDYEASLTALLTSTWSNATFSVADVSDGTGRLANGAAHLNSPLQVRATNAANPTRPFAPLSGASTPLTLLTYNTWFANDPVSIGFRQSISATEPLSAGGYTKTIAFTLSTTTP